MSIETPTFETKVWIPNYSKLKPICTDCGCNLTDKNRAVFMLKDRGPQRKNKCKKCWKLQCRKKNKDYDKRRAMFKKELILSRGGKCQICGYDDLSCMSVFDFHHVDPSKKDYQLSVYICGKSITKAQKRQIKQEFDKCIVVCSNCHRKIHFPGT